LWVFKFFVFSRLFSHDPAMLTDHSVDSSGVAPT
jgi:hypothetical protein